MVRRTHIDISKPFSNGTFIVNSEMEQIDPTSPEGKVIEKLLQRQIEDKQDSLPQKYRAEVAHNKDINNDGVIGDPKKSTSRRKRKSKKPSRVEDSHDVAVSDSNNKVPI